MNAKQQKALLWLYQKVKNYTGDLQFQDYESRNYLFISKSFHHQTAKALQRRGLISVRTYLDRNGADTNRKVALLTKKGKEVSIDLLQEEAE